jgi:hypothetical protein
MSRRFDLGIAWEWEYDDGFISVLERACQRCRVSYCIIDLDNLPEIENLTSSGEISFGVFFDRASDTRKEFSSLVNCLIQQHHVPFVNNPRDSESAGNKAAMHLEFITHGINVPYTIILPVFDKDGPTEDILKLENVGIPFIIKPAHGGGGDGVLLGAKSLAEVLAVWKDYAHDQLLIQENIVPCSLDGRQAYFRVYYAGGNVISCWWDPMHHVSERLLPDDAARYGLQEIDRIAGKIHEISRLNFFSTEIALTQEMKFISVDYVNEPCDMRLKSNTWDGVPDEVVELICEALVDFIESRSQEPEARRRSSGDSIQNSGFWTPTQS